MTQLPTLRASDASLGADAARRPDVKVAPTHSCSFGPGSEPLSAWQSMASSADLERVAQQQRDHQAWVTRARLADHRMPGGVLSAGSAPSLLPPPGPAPIFNLPVGPNPPHVSASVSSSPTSSAAPSPIRPRAFATALRPAPRTGPTSATVLGSLQMFVATPHERELNKTSRSGRQLSELEILQEKHEPEFRRLVPVVAEALRDVLAQHEAAARTTQRDERYVAYDTSAVPQIQIDDYVQRIAECTYISPATMLGALVTMDRLLGRHPTLMLSALNIFKIFFVAVRIASKVIDIRTLNNRNFASVGGTSLRHLNEMECRMLCDLQFDLYISPRDILQYASRAFPPAVGVPIPYGANAVAMLGLPPPVAGASSSMSLEPQSGLLLPPAGGAQRAASQQQQQPSQPVAVAAGRATSAASSSSVRR